MALAPLARGVRGFGASLMASARSSWFSRAARRVLLPAVEPRTYRSLIYLLLSFPVGIGYSGFLAAGLTAGVALTVAVFGALIGVPLLVGMLYAWRALAQLERWLVRILLDADIPPPYRALPAAGRRARLRARLLDKATWKDLLYLVGHFPLSVVWFAVSTMLLLLTFLLLGAPLYYGVLPAGALELPGWGIDTLPEALALVPFGIATGLALVHAANGMAALHRAFAGATLGRWSPTELRERVEELSGSSARIVDAADAERRRIERDLHDGAQQRLVALSLNLGLARQKLESDPEGARETIDAAHLEARLALEELRELARGIHPSVLTDRGLPAALEALATRSAVPVELDVELLARLPERLEAAAYFVVSEALANVAKYAQATHASVTVRDHDGHALVEVRDDGVGGADPAGGSGLRGLADRVTAVGGRIELASPAGEGTLLRAELPLPAPRRT